MAKKANKAAAPKRAAKARDKALKTQAERTLSGKPDPVVQSKPADHKQVRGIAGVPAHARSKVIEITYVPPAGEAQQVTIDGIPFKAFEPVAIPVDRQNMVQTLAQNPHFTTGKPDTKSQNYKEWALQEKHSHERTLMQERHNKEMVKLRGAGYTADGDLLPAQSNPNPPRTS